MPLKNHLVAIHSLRRRGKDEIAPGTVFTYGSGDSKEVARLYGLDAIREANDDEVTLYEARVKEGSQPAIVFGEDAPDATDAVINTDGTGQTETKGAQAATAADAAKVAADKEAAKAANKASGKKADEEI